MCCKATIKPLDKFRVVISSFFFPPSLSSITTVSAFEPDFVFPLENVTVAQGRDATFTCVVNNLGGYRVSGESGSPARVRISFSMHANTVFNHCL